MQAQVTQFPNGSFETGTLSDWNSLGLGSDVNSSAATDCDVIFTAGGSNSIGFAESENPTLETNPPFASDGFYYADFQDNTTQLNDLCEKFHNTTLSNFNAGTYVFSVDFNKISGTALNEFGLVINDINLACGLTSPVTGAGTYSCALKTTSDFNVQFFLTSRSDSVVSRVSLDNFRYELSPSLEMSVQEENDPFPIDVNFSLTAEVLLDTNDMEVTNANCTLNWGGTNASMPYNTSIGKYEYTAIKTAPDTVSYVVGCSHASYPSDQNISGTVTFVVDLSTGNKLTVTDIENVSHVIQSNQVDFNPTSDSSQVIFSIENNYTSSLNVPQHIFNSLIDNRQYFVYTANQAQYDLGNWVFNDSLTFGITNSDPVQKIWDENAGEYDYSYSDTLLVGQKKYYKLTYFKPYKNFQTIGSSAEWSSTLAPSLVDTNTVDTDRYQVSVFSNIRSVYIEQVPNIFGDENSAFEFQFTAWSDANNVTLNAGQTIFDSDSTEQVTLTSSPHRYSFTIDATNFNSQILFKSSSTSPHSIYMYDYSIVPRGYFTKRLELRKLNGDFLDLFLVNNVSKQYVSEGKDFRAMTEAFDREGHLEELRVESFFDTIGSDVNKVSLYSTDLSTGNETLFTFDQTVPGIIDLNGTAVSPTTPRDFIVKATLLDDAGLAISEQSLPIKFVQYPYFPGDLSIIFFPTEKKKGKNPAGVLQMNITATSTLLGYDIRLWDSNTGTTINSPLYQSRIYKDVDFSCIGSNCGVQLKIPDFILQDTGQTFIAITAMLNTENFNLTNPLTQTLRSIYVTDVEYDVAKIHQLNERTDRTYKNTEEIPVVLILRDTDATNIYDKTKVYITLANCDDSTPANGNCVEQTTKFNNTGYQYDDKSNLNYYFFRHLWYLDNGSLLPDNNFIAMRAHVSDAKGVSTPILPVLADKCQVNGTDFWSNAIASIINGLGCATPQDSIVVLGNSQERAIEIDFNHVTTAPSQELFACINVDTNNVIDKPLEANLYCFTWYQVSEKPIDNFRLRITNQYSALNDTGTTKQYVEFNIPYELVAMNDLPLLKQELETNQQTTITSMQDFIQAGFAGIARGGLKNLGIETIIDNSNLIGNIGSDINLNQAFDPTSVGGFAWFRIKGIPVVNAQDFRYDNRVEEEFDYIDRTHFLNYLAENGVTYSAIPAELELVINSFAIPKKIVDLNGHLLIDEEGSTEKINVQNTDQNRLQPYKFIPAVLYFTIQNTMFYENQTGNDTKALIIKITTIISQNILAGYNEFIDKLLSDPKGAFIDLLYDNLGLIVIILGIVLVVSFIYFNFKRQSGG